MTKTILGTAAMLAMVAGPAMAAPVTNPASALSVGKTARVGTPLVRKSKALNGTGAIVVGLLATAAVVGAVIAISDDDDSDSN